MARVRATCRRRNMIVLTPSRPIEDSDRRRPSSSVWTNVIDLCDRGIWTLVDGCNGIITLSGKPWCRALDLINQMSFGEVFLSNFVGLEQTMKPKRSWDSIDLIVNSIMEIDESTKWDRSIATVDAICVWWWINSLTPADRERWHEWRERSCYDSKLRFGRGSVKGPFGFELSKGKWNEVYASERYQNRLWSEERNELEKLLSGFEWKRFETTRYVLELTETNQIGLQDRRWLKRMEKAWLSEGEGLARIRGKWETFPRGERQRIIERLKRGRNVNGNGWKCELEWGTEQKLKDEERLRDIKPYLTWNEEWEDGNRNGKLQPEGWNDEKGKCLTETIKTEEEEGEVANVERELDDEWEREWYLKRGPQVWKKHYTETESCVVETCYGNLTGSRTLRPTYGVLIGLDVQTEMLTAAVNERLLAYVCDFSLNNEEVTLLQTKWKDDCAIKMAPVALNYGLDDVLVEIDVEGYKHLKFVDERTSQSLVGKVVSIGGTETTIELENGIYGKLRFAGTADNFEIEVGMKVDVMITDFNPITNDINL
ncbi:MAG: hypothetical protein ACTS80_01015, partial [Candidatus Hodgkinia cicadicola]